MFRCVIKYLLWLFLFLRMAIEVGSCLKHKDRYIKDAMNYLEIILYTFTIFYLMEIEIDPTSSSSGNTKRLVWFTIDMYPKTEWQQAFGSLAILGSWLNLLMFIRQMPKYGLYVLMFTHVLTTFMEFVVVLFIFICAFSFTFIMLLGNKIPFHNIPKSIVTTLVMMIGEMDYGDKLLGHISEDASGETPEFTMLTNDDPKAAAPSSVSCVLHRIQGNHSVTCCFASTKPAASSRCRTSAAVSA